MRRSRLRSAELMVVMTVAMTLLLLAIGWIHQSLKFGSVMRQRQHHHHTCLRLSRQLRDDVHRAQSMELRDEQTLELTVVPDEQVIYTIAAGKVTRRVQREDKVTGQELFMFQPTALPHWDTSEMPDWITLVVDRGAGVAQGPPNDASGIYPIEDELPPADLHVRASVARWKFREQASR